METKEVRRANRKARTRPAQPTRPPNPLLAPIDSFAHTLLDGPSQRFRELQKACRSLPLPARRSEKAHYLYKFLNLAQLHKESDLKEFRVAIVGDPKMKAIFAKEVEGKLVRGKPIKLAPLGGPEQMKDLSLVYIDREHPALESLTLKARYLDTLTVSGGRTHRAQAADMQLIPGPNRLGFLLNTDNLRRKRTVLSPRLIRSASVLKTNRGLTAR